MGFHWYVLRTRPSCENVAATELDRGGFDVFNPRASILRAKQGSRIVPLFPGYLFVRFDGDRDFPSILRFTGVSGWVKFGGEVPAVPDEVIDEISNRVETMNRNSGLWKGYLAGDTVRLVSGFLETEVEVAEDVASPNARVNVLLEFMGRRIKAQTSWRNLERLQEDVGAGPTDQSRRRTRGKGRWIKGRLVATAANI